MQRIEGVEAVFGYCAFYAASGAIVEEYDHGCEDESNHAIVYHQRQCEENLNYRLRGEADFIPADPWLDGLMA